VLSGVNGDAGWVEGGRDRDRDRDRDAVRERVGQDAAADVAENAVGGVEEA
jgi:hypothetical protein